MPTLVGQTIRDIAFDEKRQIKMTYWPERWETAPDWRFDWADLKFPPDEGEPVPDAPGVYIFALKPKVFDFLSIGVLYVGKATSLRSRIREYIRLIDSDFTEVPRPHIWMMVNLFNGHLRYCFTTTESVARAEEVESEMQKALNPYFCKARPAEISARVRAFTN